MCLSSVYKVNNGQPELFCKNVQNIRIDHETGDLSFVDIMGMQYVLKGRILDINLVDNTIDVEEV